MTIYRIAEYLGEDKPFAIEYEHEGRWHAINALPTEERARAALKSIVEGPRVLVTVSVAEPPSAAQTVDP